MSDIDKTIRKKMVSAALLAAIAAAMPVTASETAEASEEGQAQTETSQTDFTVCKVNGVSLTNEQFCEMYTYYAEVFALQGYDTSSEEIEEYISEHSYTAVIENELLSQGLQEDGYADYEALEADLMDGYACTEEDIEEYYGKAAAQDEENYKDNVALYEQVLYNTDTDIWYIPDGYRKVLELVLDADDEELEEKIAAVKEEAAQGKDFAELVKEYSADEETKREEVLESGLKMNPQSTVWNEDVLNAVFAEEMDECGDVSEPVEIDGKVYLFCYVEDVQAGPVELTDSLKEHIEEILWDNTANAKIEEYISQKSSEAVILTVADPDYSILENE